MDWSLSRVNRGRSGKQGQVPIYIGGWYIARIMLAAAMLLTASAVRAATNVSGVARDSITGQPVAGAQVMISNGQVTLGTATTESDGVFQLFVNVPTSIAPQMLNLSVSQPGYAPLVRNVVVTAGRADQLSYKLSLPRNEARNCNPAWARTVVVGHVRPPASATVDLALSQRISEVLQYDLLTEVQKTHLPAAQQPMVMACPDAQPRTLGEYADWARALKVDAFVVGAAQPVNQRFRVDLQVSGRYTGSILPISALTPPMNLDLPSSADLGRAALEPIMIALLKAYQSEGRYAECVEFSVAAEHALGRVAALSELRTACQSRLLNRGLLTGGGP
jgi:hypothetical protein